jgi:hypothetical protein
LQAVGVHIPGAIRRAVRDGHALVHRDGLVDRRLDVGIGPVSGVAPDPLGDDPRSREGGEVGCVLGLAPLRQRVAAVDDEADRGDYHEGHDEGKESERLPSLSISPATTPNHLVLPS